MIGKINSKHLLYLILGIIIVSLATTVTLSRYSTTISGTGTATAAAIALPKDESASFEVSSPQKPGDTGVYKFKVVNFNDTNPNERVSDVTQSYSITVEDMGNLPLEYSLSSSDNPTTNYALTNTEGTNIWTGGQLPHTTLTTHNYELTVTWPADEYNSELSTEIDYVTVIVNSEQVTLTQ